MPRPQAALLLVPLALGTLLTATSCSARYLDMDEGGDGTPTASATPTRTAPASTGAAPALTAAQAQAVLVTDADLGPAWVPTRGAATWRDGMLKTTGAPADCARLLDALYADELLGSPARATTGLDNTDTDAQLRYQVTARPRADVDRTLVWLATVPRTCAHFTATTALGVAQDVQVTDTALPVVGDARQGLRVTVTAPPADGAEEPTVLTLDVAVVRQGDDAFTLTNGGLTDVPSDATQVAVQLGALRLAEVRKQGRAQV
ncbi:hypothetical protein C3489_02980 [Streptomyces sp. Ru71]|uniref:hypothetical protein n=1 Tax=Streptomyces sp. Ru71 TaxID=2080746 RepID=UPI000CDDD053|nr:hypothetical protein [Streptomyces sp. Ru71]POX56769.1 hypothetical protein C3489_02980 [Streptomyces sp. Ru71]